MNTVLLTVCLVLQAYYFVIIARILLSFVARPPEGLLPVIRIVGRLTDPLLLPLRRVLPALRLGGGAVALDLSPIVLIIGLAVVTRLLCG